jgi:hypothetical protein
MKAILAAVVALALLAGEKTLNIYFIDVEGGQSTLIVTPAGQSLLVDAGYPERDGRDPDRIMAAVRDARLTRIDYLLVTHLHEDHDGGAAALSQRIPIGTFVDYGSPVENAKEVVAAFAGSSEARDRSRHLVPKAGDRLPLEGVIVDVVSADGTVLPSPLDGAGQRNAACADFERPPDSRGENPGRSASRFASARFVFLTSATGREQDGRSRVSGESAWRGGRLPPHASRELGPRCRRCSKPFVRVWRSPTTVRGRARRRRP